MIRRMSCQGLKPKMNLRKQDKICLVHENVKLHCKLRRSTLLLEYLSYDWRSKERCLFCLSFQELWDCVIVVYHLKRR